MDNSIYLRRKNKVVLNQGTSTLGLTYPATLLKNMESLGYVCSPTLLRAVSTLTIEDLEVFYHNFITDIRKLVGADHLFEPRYPNFPKQVLEMDELELFVNAMWQYFGDWIGVDLVRKYDKEARDDLTEQTKLTVVELGTEEDYKDICLNLLGSKTSLSDSDKADIKSFVIDYKQSLESIIPNSVPHKETLAYLSGLLLTHTDAPEKGLYKVCKTATDVLRLATALSDGDVSLAQNTKFRSFKRAERRLLLGLLENLAFITEDMLRYKDRWIRLAERLHPGEFQNRYVKTYEAFKVLRDNLPFETTNSKIEAMLMAKQARNACKVLETRPGMFARRLDQLLRLEPESSAHILGAFDGVAAKVSTPVLLQVMTHFKYRNEFLGLRTFFPKGNVAKLVSIENKLPEIKDIICNQVVAICREVLINRFKELKPLGNVYIDPDLKSFKVPFSQRSASKALRTLVRGSKLKIGAGNTLRMFVWWIEGILNGKKTDRVDLDLSAVMYDKDWKYLEHISYTNLRSSKYIAVHSGDVTSAPAHGPGGAEFIDIDLGTVVAYGGRYILMSVLSYTGQSFASLPDCFAGWMLREQPQSGEVFEPKTLQNRVDITADTKLCIPMIIDAVRREVIWADLGLKSDRALFNNVERNSRNLEMMGKSIATLVKPDLFDLFEMHALARATTIVKTANGADTIFSVDKGITPFDTEIIASQFL